MVAGLAAAGANRSTILLLSVSAFAFRAMTLGTVEPLLVLLIALAWRWRDSELRAGAVLAAGILIKPLVAPLAVFFLATRRLRSVAAAAVLVVAGWFACPGGTVAGGLAYLRELHRFSQFAGPKSMSPADLVAGGRLGRGSSRQAY